MFDEQENNENSLGEHKLSSVKASEADTVQQKQRYRSQQTTVSLRRKKYEEILNKRRTDDLADQNPNNSNAISNDRVNFFNSQQNSKPNPNLLEATTLTSSDLDAITEEAQALSGQELFDKITYVRRMISNPAARKLSPGTYIDAIINSKFLTFITRILHESNDDSLSYEATWILINIAAGNEHQTAAVVDCGALDVLINKINQQISINLKDQILWCIANVIGDGPNLRNIALEKGALGIIYKLLFDPEATLQSIKHNIAWILSNILRPAQHPVSEDMLDTIYSMIKKLITDNPNEPDVIYDSIWALFYSLSQDTHKHKLVENGFDKFLISQLNVTEERIPKTALRALMQLSSGNDEDVQVLIDNGLLDALADVFEKRTDHFKPDILTIFGNVALGWVSQKMPLIFNPVFSKILKNITSMNDKLQKEALYMVAHILEAKEEEFLKQLLTMHPDILQIFFYSLRTHTQDWLLVQRNLNALETLLTFQEALKIDIALMLEEDGALAAIEDYQVNSPPEVYNKVGSIIDRFFTNEEFAQDQIGQNVINNTMSGGPGKNVFDF